MAQTLNQLFGVKRRFLRSINLERDSTHPEFLEGYVCTERAMDAFHRIARGFSGETGENAWTLTGIYGTGKSAFAHVLTACCSPRNSADRKGADRIFHQNKLDSPFSQDVVPTIGFFQALATAHAEPVTHTVLRALHRGCQTFWPAGMLRPEVVREVAGYVETLRPTDRIESTLILKFIDDILAAAQTNVLIVLDELGKNLEFAVHHRGAADMFLLQQLAEIPRRANQGVYVVGLLHQAFAAYGQRLGTIQGNEWAKIQGRFGDIPFTESASQMLRMIGQVIEPPPNSMDGIGKWPNCAAWSAVLEKLEVFDDFPPAALAAALPLHPIAALMLPRMCMWYAQNDRSLFTFLCGPEPYGLQSFLGETRIDETGRWPLFQVHHLYDYFVESAGLGRIPGTNSQRWAEIRGLITDAQTLPPDLVRVLKTVGLINLITAGQSFRARREMVVLALCQSPDDMAEREYWWGCLERLFEQKRLLYRKSFDEVRIWEGSDFQIEPAIAATIEKSTATLAELLTAAIPLKPLIAQRHSLTTGTLRYFERLYIDQTTDFGRLACARPDADGLIGLWVDETQPTTVPATTADGKPLLVVAGLNLDILKLHAEESAALVRIFTHTPELQTDAVARREVRERIAQSQQMLDQAMAQAFGMRGEPCPAWVCGQAELLHHPATLRKTLSEVCDQVYRHSPKLRNELINRRELTSQGAKARRLLLEAMLAAPDQPRLGLTGNGPEVSMYLSALASTGIHREEKGVWGFYPPIDSDSFQVSAVWNQFETFCTEAGEHSFSINQLYQRLEAPPYGVKRGLIPVLLTAFLMQRTEDVCLYKDGTFVPVLGAEHFEILFRDPSRFALRSYRATGIETTVLTVIRQLFQLPPIKPTPGLRNETLLGAIRPLLQFARKLPAYTQQTKHVSPEARQVFRCLIQAQEPDRLLFQMLPIACELSPITALTSESDVHKFGRELQERLQELNQAYPSLLERCEAVLGKTLGIQPDHHLRKTLQNRAGFLANSYSESALKRFIIAVCDDTKTDLAWRESVLMVVSDKSPQSWKDDDEATFLHKLSDIARQFENLEALTHALSSNPDESRDTVRLTLTKSDGRETHKMIRVSLENRIHLEAVVAEILSRPEFSNGSGLREALLAIAAEQIFGEPLPSLSEAKEPPQTRSAP